MPTKKQPTIRPPDDLSGESLLEWDRITAELDAIGKLLPEYRAAIAIYCRASEEAHDCQRHIDKEGAVVKLPNGYPASNPWCKPRDAAIKTCVRILCELGLTPKGKIGAAVEIEPEEELV